MNSIWAINWLQKNSNDRFNYVLNNYKIRVNLQNREVLYAVEEHLKNGESLDLPKLIEIDKKSQTVEPTLFDQI
jgi:hypothetical protein